MEKMQPLKIWTLPNALTFVRILLIPCVILFFYTPFHYHKLVTACIFLLAAATDWLDGYLARQLKQTSPFGAFLDPVADKLVVAAALILLVAEYPVIWVAVPGIVIVSREIVISALREWMAELGQRATVKVSYVGKVKTVFQMVAVTVLLSQQTNYHSWVVWLGFILLYVATVLTLWSMFIYLSAAWKVLVLEPVKENRQKQQENS